MWRYDTTELTEAPVFELGIGPAGNLYSTTEDLGKLIHTLFAIKRDERPDLLSARSLKEMWTVQFSDDSSGFGIGFHVSDHNGHITHRTCRYDLWIQHTCLRPAQFKK